MDQIVPGFRWENMLTVHAYAKVNLTLEVLGRRPDGYHEIATVLQQINLRDTLTFEEHSELILGCDVDYLRSPQNIVHKAAKLIQERFGVNKGVAISVTKGIPVAAGLGGGSSDAVATIKALNDLWGLSLSPGKLLGLANELGSDTAFFIHGGTALAEGRGEVLTELPSLPASWAVLFKPPVDIPRSKTGSLYSALDTSHFSDGGHVKEVVEVIKGRGNVSPAIFFNTFEQVAAGVFTGLEEYRQRFIDLGAEHVHLSGSGPTLFTLTSDEGSAEKLYRSLVAQGMEAYIVQTVARD